MAKGLSDALYAMAPRAHLYEFNVSLSDETSLIWASLVNSGEGLLDSLLEKGRTEKMVLVHGLMLSANVLTLLVMSTTFALHRPRSWRYCGQTRRTPLITSGPPFT